MVDNNVDKYVDKQKTIITDYFSYADGKCGERISKMLIEDLKKEIF